MGDDQDMDYIGDSVYVSHDGYQIWLRLNDHRSPALVALEPGVLANLDDYRRRVGIGVPK